MRADKYFAERFGSRTKAAEAIERGLVLVNGKPIQPKTEIKESDAVTFAQAEQTFVSNGGYKLQAAVDAFSFDCKGKAFADLGASTGGFTDCLLQNGAKRVYAVDVGESLLHERIAGDSRILRMENRNARYLTKEDFPECLDGVVADLSFISLRLILPVIAALLPEGGEALVLVKPQFECARKDIGKSGILSTALHIDVIKRILQYARESGVYPYGIVNAPIRKGKNIEYMLWAGRNEGRATTEAALLRAVKDIIRKSKEDER